MKSLRNSSTEYPQNGTTNKCIHTPHLQVSYKLKSCTEQRVEFTRYLVKDDEDKAHYFKIGNE